MKTFFRVWLLVALMGENVFGLGSDYRNGESVGGTDGWPAGLKELVNTTNRVHGFFVNAQDYFFFSGNATNLFMFLHDYAKIEGIEKHQLILHDGVGEAKSPWEKTGRPCDWQIFTCPRSWLALGKMAEGTNSLAVMQQAAKNTNFVLEVHFWTGGKIDLNQLTLPRNVELAGEPLRNFEAITNGMTRAEVERRLKMDGGLQGASPVRFIDPKCRGVKIGVEFDFKKDAADQGCAITNAADTVVRVSKPYLEPPFMD